MAASAGGGAVRALSQKEQDIQMMLAADVHLGTKNCDFQMERYVFKRRTDGIYIINLGKTWDKLQLAARVIVAIENPQDIIVQSARPYGQRAVLKFAQYTGAHAIAGRHTPDWGAAPAPVPTGDGWDQTVAPVPVDGTVPPVVAPTGWESAAQPTAQGWE
ncbi:40S ribosomal protein Sa-1 [Zea mays]|uniref:40S ribosomal protein Sa-1 n=1 Tax=Zea mays TaxID=4577 RepID=A0A1D6PIR4_MAIZE|nr:40S ribosomal protein Sa-1 [Zea mays]